MGNANNSNSSLEKGQGFRILKVAEDSPFRGKVDEFFDFIIQVIPQTVEKSPTQILDRLSPAPSAEVEKSPLQILNENAGKDIKVRVVSTKYRNSRTIQVTLRDKSEENKDLTGLKLRKQRYDQAFDTYFPLTDMQSNSPVKKAGLREGLYLIGCLQFSYQTIEAFHEGLYERYFNKELSNKNINLVLYDIATDSTIVREIQLKRGWGGRGLLGCQFLQGMLNKFPHNLEEQRRELKLKDKEKREVDKLRNSLGDCDGASRALLQALEYQRGKKSKHFRNLKNLLNIEPPNLSAIQKPREELKYMAEQALPSRSSPYPNQEQNRRMEELQRRVVSLQHTLLAVKEYINKIEVPEEDEIEKQ